LLVEHFDVIINPDAAADACALAHLARGAQHVGFNVDARGTPLALSPAAERWLEMGVRDDRKRANKLTYQEHMAAVMGVDWRLEPPILELRESDQAAGQRLRSKHAPAPGGSVIGLNTGA